MTGLSSMGLRLVGDNLSETSHRMTEDRANGVPSYHTPQMTDYGLVYE